MPFKITGFTTFLFLSIFILAFFPSLFNHLLHLPLHLLSSPTPPSPTTHSPTNNTNTMSWLQKSISLPPKSRGSYLITDHILSHIPELAQYRVGLLHLFVQHTSCALSLNENWDKDVRRDMDDALDRIVPEDHGGGDVKGGRGGAGGGGGGLYRHSAEGADDMPAHVKSALIGASVTVPIKDGKLAMGTWQGIWYLEFRAAKHSRRVVATVQGEKV